MDGQGKGLGRKLLAASLIVMHGLGYRHASISTALRNARGQLFYSNFGYRTAEWNYQLLKQLGPEPGSRL